VATRPQYSPSKANTSKGYWLQNSGQKQGPLIRPP